MSELKLAGLMGFASIGVAYFLALIVLGIWFAIDAYRLKKIREKTNHG